MKPTLNEKFIAYLALLSGLSVSAVAIYYSVAGLTAIFAAAVIPIIVMGVVLEVSKLVATVWLKQNWNTAPFLIKIYLMMAIAVLMLITSLGIFGFLSKSHSDQSLVSGDVIAKIAIYDEKIKTAKENIEINRRALKQMDDAVDQVMGRSTSETGAEKAVSIRRNQTKERTRLLSEISAEQDTISKLNEQRAPIAADVRQVEAEVGPIKYIAAFVYGNTDQNVLEKAVTWVIISLIIVFDPLAVMLLLASQVSFQQFKERESIMEGDSPKVEDANVVGEITVTQSVDDTPTTLPKFSEATHAAYTAQHTNRIKDIEGSTPWPLDEKIDFDDHPYLFNVSTSSHIVPGIERVTPLVYTPDPVIVPPVPSMVKVLPSSPITKVFPRPQTFVIPETYVQNEEQQESNLWTNTVEGSILPEDYKKIARENKDRQIAEWIDMVKTKRMGIESIPEEFQAIVKAKV